MRQALTHRSVGQENNEVLEFLGDSVLNLVITEALVARNSDLDEGQLSKVRASLVNESALAEQALQLKVNEYIKFGKGEALTGGATKPRLLACAYEALVGAIYLDRGIDASKDFIIKDFAKILDALDSDSHFEGDYKTRLQEKTQQTFKKIPTYKLVAEKGPDHEKTFHIEVSVGDKLLAEGAGKSKKQAEQDAASKALEVLK